MELNPSQLRAVSHGSGPCLVLAGPGSGKTTVIIRRIQNLITQYHIRPENILAVTFSRAAAEEMSQRFSGADGVTFGTVHSIFLRILKEDLRRDLSVISENDSIAFMKMEIKKYSIPCRSADAMARELLLSVSRMKSGGAPSMHIPYETFMKVFSDYSAFLHERAFFDFDDIINECCRLLRSSPSVLAKWHERYKFILADEFQDLSPVQYMCIRLLAGPSGNIFAVGDDDQSIYGFRGAGSGIMRRFLSDFPAAVQILLDVNYRCASRILSASLDVIRENAGRFEKEFSPFRQGGLVNLRSYATRREEYREVIQNIRKLDLAGKDIAVLFRGNYDSYLFTQMLLREGLRFSCRDNTDGLADRFAVRDVLRYLRVAAALNSRTLAPARDDILHIVNRPERFIRRDSLLGAPADAASCFASMLSNYRSEPATLVNVRKLQNDLYMIAGLSPYAAVSYVRKVVGYDKWLCSYAPGKGLDIDECLENLDALSEFAAVYESFDELLEAVNSARVVGDDRAGIHVMTMHASKGMEFDAVFLPDLIEGIIPAKNAVKEGTIDEERRLLYVAMTRAKEELHLSWVREYRFKEARLSRLVEKFAGF